MNNLIVVPQKIKLGMYSIMVKEICYELVCVCPVCGRELIPNEFKNKCCESEWIFCSDGCVQSWVDQMVNKCGKDCEL